MKVIKYNNNSLIAGAVIFDFYVPDLGEGKADVSIKNIPSSFSKKP